MNRLPVYLLLAVFLITGCRNKDLVRPGEPINVAFDKSVALFEKEKYGDAAYGFDQVTRLGRGSNYAEEAQFYLAESYFLNKQYILAASEYDRFLAYYPQNARVQEVDYKRAVCLYMQSPRYRLDQSSTLRAIELFQLFNSKYPDSEYVQESAQRIDELRNKLARKNFEAAEFYLRTQRYLAATIYFDQTIDQYPESVWAERALVRQIETYITYADNSITEKQNERYNLAVSTYEKFIQLFPQSQDRGKAESLYLEAQDKLSKLSPSVEGVALGDN
ncbi:MAG: outer membrane protein assembly factor BamD [Balneola sp.]|nr:MAG: outer membrane protein assembly factor BamD [Balneola sp.]